MKFTSKQIIKLINVVLIAFISILFISEIVSGKFELNDFKVYYLAMKNFCNNQPIYGIPFGLGSGYFKYTPIALFPFMIFYFIPYFYASIIYYFIVGVFVLFFFNFFQKISKEFINNSNINYTALIVTILSSFVHIHRELHLGNVNMILLSLYSFVFYLILKDKSVLAGILIGIGFLFKLHFIVLIPVLLIYRRIKISLISFATFLISLFIIFPIKGFNNGLSIYFEWINIMKFHNTNILNHPDTVYFNVVKLFNILNISLANYSVFLLVFITISILFIHFIISSGTIFKKYLDFTTFGLVYYFAIAMIPSLTLTDTEHFLYTLPIIYIGSVLIFNNNVSLLSKSIFIIGLFFYGANIHDLWGHKLSVFIADNGFLGLGNLIIVTITFIYSYKAIKLKET